MWLHYYRGAFDKIDTYSFRSNISPLMMAAWDMRDKGLDYALARKLTGQWRQVAPFMFGDFYPLTDYSLASDVWMAFQFDRPDVGEGMVQAFRRTDSATESICVKLLGLDPKAEYVVTNLDTAGTTEMTGRDLMEGGLTIAIAAPPGAAVVTYKKKRH
jgi:alpha-galactosidase